MWRMGSSYQLNEKKLSTAEFLRYFYGHFYRSFMTFVTASGILYAGSLTSPLSICNQPMLLEKEATMVELGVFLPVLNNGWVISTAAPQYHPSYTMNKAMTLLAGSCTQGLRIIVLPRKPGKMSLFHTDVRGRCHGVAPVFLPVRTDRTRVAVLPATLCLAA